jgi:hypothetical protein
MDPFFLNWNLRAKLAKTVSIRFLEKVLKSYVRWNFLYLIKD